MGLERVEAKLLISGAGGCKRQEWQVQTVDMAVVSGGRADKLSMSWFLLIASHDNLV